MNDPVPAVRTLAQIREEIDRQMQRGQMIVLLPRDVRVLLDEIERLTTDQRIGNWIEFPPSWTKEIIVHACMAIKRLADRLGSPALEVDEGTSYAEAIIREAERRAAMDATAAVRCAQSDFESDMRALEQRIAYDAARSDIETRCVGHVGPGGVTDWWYDLDDVNDYDSQFVADAVRYLEHRQLLKHHPDNHRHVKPLGIP